MEFLRTDVVNLMVIVAGILCLVDILLNIRDYVNMSRLKREKLKLEVKLLQTQIESHPLEKKLLEIQLGIEEQMQNVSTKK